MEINISKLERAILHALRQQPVCPSCQQETAKRMISSGGGVLFRGSGFYQTDYKAGSFSKEAGNKDSK